MKTWVRKSISVGVMAAGGLLATQAAAHAADAVTTNNFGALNGNQIVLDPQIPINLCGNSIALVGGAFAHCGGGAVAINGGGHDSDDRKHDGYGKKHHDDEFAAMAEGKDKKHGKKDFRDAGSAWITSGNYGILNGNQIKISPQIPINVAGNAIGLIGGAFASADGGAIAVQESARTEGYDKGRDGGAEGAWISTNNFGALNGNQIHAPIQIPINICGNAIALVGGAFAHCGGGAVAVQESAGAEEGLWYTSNNFGLLNGNQVKFSPQIPINICGNAIAVLALAQASCGGGAVAIQESATTESARDEALPLVGSLPAVAGLPVVGSLAGQGAAPVAPKMDTAPGARSGATEGDDYDGDRHDKRNKKHGKDGRDGNGFSGAVAVQGGKTFISSNNFGLLNGNQVAIDPQIPINVAGNAIGIIGGAFASAGGGAAAING